MENFLPGFNCILQADVVNAPALSFSRASAAPEKPASERRVPAAAGNVFSLLIGVTHGILQASGQPPDDIASELRVEISTKSRDVPLFQDFSSLQPTDTAFFEGNGNISRKGVRDNMYLLEGFADSALPV
jgi:hypothetical protein